MDPELTTVEIHDIAKTPRGKKALNAFLSSGAELFETARGRLAIHIKRDTLAKLLKSLGLGLRDSYDGLRALFFAVNEKALDKADKATE